MKAMKTRMWKKNLFNEIQDVTAKELYNRFKILHCQLLHHGKCENRNYLVFLLNEMLRQKFTRQEGYQKAIDTLDIEMVEEEEIRDKGRRGRSIEMIAGVFHGLFSYTWQGGVEGIN